MRYAESLKEEQTASLNPHEPWEKLFLFALDGSCGRVAYIASHPSMLPVLQDAKQDTGNEQGNGNKFYIPSIFMM
jgi:hypothetical protein